jgi:hypothetical protein
MATFTFGRTVDIHWNGYDIVGPAGTVFSIPDQLYEEFDADIAPVEPTLTWVDTNEFLTLSNSVSVSALEATFPISATTTTTGKLISIVSTSASDGYVLTANGSGGVAWEALPGDATGITSIIGTSPISAAVSGTQATISLSASYQTAGTYVNAVIGTSPASVSTASGTSTVSIVAGSIDSSHLSATSVGSSQLIDGAVNSTKIADNAVVAAKIDAGAVTSAKIADDAVVTSKIIDSAVTSSKLADGSVVAAKISAGAVGSAAISAGAVGSAAIASGSVNTSAINSGAAASGTVLTANGTGGATFQSAAAAGFNPFLTVGM